MPAASGSLFGKIAWHWRHDEKCELWLGWWTLVVFYNLYGVLFFMVARTQPPPQPMLSPDEIVRWFEERHDGLLYGYAFVFIVGGATAVMNATLAYTMRRMSVSRAFGYSYLLIYALATLPGMLIMGIVCTVGAMRPDRDPALMSWLYDFAFLSFEGTMGVFLIGSLVWMAAVLLDENDVFPKWFGYLNLCNALTEVVVAPAWIFKRGVFAWDGTIAWWINMAVFCVYTTSFLTLIRKLIVREDFGSGRLPALELDHRPAPAGARGVVR
jgi:hypothetical protein